MFKIEIVFQKLGRHPDTFVLKIVYNFVSKNKFVFQESNSMKISLILIFLIALCNPTSSFAQSKKSIEFDPDDPPETTIRLAPYLTFGGQLEVEFDYKRNFDLDGEDDEDEYLVEPALGFAFSFDPNEKFQAFLAFTVFWEFLFEDSDKTGDMIGLEIEQAYFLFKDILDSRFSFQVGRQRFEDEREWLFDEELDAVRIFYNVSNFTTGLSVSRFNLLDRDLLNSDEEDQINNYLLRTVYEIDNDDKEIIASAYLFFRDDRSEDNESPFLLGVSANGDFLENIAYWFEFSFALGKEGSEDIRAFGFDLGFSYEFDLPLEPTLTFGFAFGSGDDDSEDNEANDFRQSGFHNNESSFNGAVDFKYYGEVFDPELSNLLIFTAGVGFNITDNSSVDFIYHYYQQHKRTDNFRDVGVDAEPDGESKSIGNEIDLVIGYEEILNTEFALRLGYFIPGNAFESDSANAFSVLVEFQYELRQKN